MPDVETPNVMATPPSFTELAQVSIDGNDDAIAKLSKLLLEQFPDYPFVREVRERLKQLEEASSIG